MDLPKQFVFYVDGSPSFYHLAVVRDGKVTVDWDEVYAEQTPCPEGWWDSVEVATVRQWVETGGWVIVGRHQRMVTSKESLQRSFTSLQMGFEALAEGFESLRLAFENAKLRVQQEGK